VSATVTSAAPTPHPWNAPITCALITAACVMITWDAVLQLPLMHDEWAYWMQAQQYAALSWSQPSPRLPEFFEQLYVLVSPEYAAKYWPGHAMAIAAGFVVGFPWLLPLVLSAASGALVFLLGRRVAGPRVASLTFVLWVSTFGNLRFRASYFSEITTSFAWLLAWWALLEWRATRNVNWMVTLALATGLGAITRPATMFVFAIPVGLLVIADVWRAAGEQRAKLARQLAIGIAVGTAVLAILPLWSARTTGSARLTPLAAYTQQYLPFDVPGYSVSDTPPERTVPPEMERVRGFLREIKVEQATAPVWRTFAERAGFLLRDAFAGWRLPFVLAFAVGLAVSGPVVWFAFGSVLLLVAGYVTQAHTRDWTVYYLEAFPVVALIAALGTRHIARSAQARFALLPRADALPRIALRLLSAGVVALLLRDTYTAAQTLAKVGARTVAFRDGVARLEHAPNVVFVRYAERRNMHLALVANEGILDLAPSWIVHDRGADNARLMELVPGRTAYLYDEASGAFTEMQR
jgi:4-amino-4-deoxy-L-arabinose transferase-like glycosyltransferase